MEHTNQWSVIVWHTGTPDKAGNYIVTGKSEEGIFVIEDIFMSNNEGGFVALAKSLRGVR